jgi:tRNA threonylcarbamoyladenosine biosynthesis protein TsaE
MKQEFNVDKLDDWESVANALVAKLERSPDLKHVLLEGNLGAGKTTLVQHVVKRLGGEDLVQSPTFAIVNEYVVANHQPVYHLDLYRLKNQSELIEAGILNTLDSGNLCFIEWPSLAKSFLGDNVLNVDIVLGENGNRNVTLYRV